MFKTIPAYLALALFSSSAFAAVDLIKVLPHEAICYEGGSPQAWVDGVNLEPGVTVLKSTTQVQNTVFSICLRGAESADSYTLHQIEMTTPGFWCETYRSLTNATCTGKVGVQHY